MARIFVLVSLLALFAAGHQVEAQVAGPLNTIAGRKVSVGAVTAKSVASLLQTAGVTVDTNCSVKIYANDATVLCVGGSDVDCSTKYYPICSSSSCGESVFPLDARAGKLFLLSSSGTLTNVFIIAGGGC